MRRIKFTPEFLEQMNLTPMMDTAMTLLLIFVIISPIIGRGIEVNLPEATADRLPVTATVLLAVDRAGDIFLAGEPVQPRYLPGDLRSLKESNPDVRVIVHGDREVRYEKVVYLLEVVRQAGISNVGLATRVPEQGE